MNQRKGAAAKLLAHQVHGQRVGGVEADVEAPCPGLPVADVGAHDGAAFRRVDRPQEMPQFVDQHFQPVRLGDLVAPLADEDVRAERAARAAHVPLAAERLVLAGPADRQPRRGRLDRPLELRDELPQVAGAVLGVPGADRHHLEADAARAAR